MNYFSKLLCVLALICLGENSFTQNYSFLSYSNDVGLPQSQVQTVMQDEEGYLWVGTLGGLARFNGKRFVPFSVEQGIFNNRIACLKSVNNEIWVGHQGGISVIKGKKAQSWALPENLKNDNVTAIVYFNNTIYFSVEGGGVFYLKDKKLRTINLPSGDAQTCRVLLVKDNKLLAGTRDGIYEVSTNNTPRKLDAFGKQSVSTLLTVGNQLYVTTFSSGFYKASSDYKTFTKLDDIPDLYIYSAFVDRDSKLWLCTDLGIINWKSRGNYIQYSSSNGMPTDGINCIFQDKEGTIWLGSDGKGLLRFCGNQWVHYTNRQLPSDLILSGKKIGNNQYVFGSYDEGAFQMNLNGKATPLNLPASLVWSIETLGKKTYYGTDLGLFVQNGNQFKLISGEGNEIRFLFRHGNKLIVLGDDEIGIVQNEIYKKLELPEGSMQKLGTVRQLADFNSKLILGSSNGIFELSLESKRIKKIKSFNSGVFTLEVDQQNQLWIGTENGLYVYDEIAFEPFSLGTSSGSKFINFLKCIDDNLFIGTNNGLFVVKISNEETTITGQFGLNSGLINLESNVNSCFFDNRYLWFGTAQGLVRFDVKSHDGSIPEQFNPNLVITSISVNFSPFNYAFSSGTTPVGGEIRLPHSKNNLSIDFDALFLNDPETVLMQYWIEGLDEKWHPPSSNTNITLSNLPDGDYTLHIRCLNEFGMISEESTIPIVITPPYYRTWWFYLILVALVIVGVRSYFLWQLRRERERNYKENLENRTRLLALEQQSLNASMNRHFIFNSLNSIQYFINTQDKASANRYLSNFAKLIRKNLDSATENDNMVTLHQELERLELYLSLECMRFKDRFDYIIDRGDLDLEQIEVPSMLLQPFVENSIIHGILPDESRKGHIEVRLKLIAQQLEICIDDNGIGIDVSMTKKAAFHGDHKSKGMEITSKRISLIRTMLKKEFDLIGPFQVTNPDHTIKGTRVLIKIPCENLEL